MKRESDVHSLACFNSANIKNSFLFVVLKWVDANGNQG